MRPPHCWSWSDLGQMDEWPSPTELSVCHLEFHNGRKAGYKCRKTHTYKPLSCMKAEMQFYVHCQGFKLIGHAGKYIYNCISGFFHFHETCEEVFYLKCFFFCFSICHFTFFTFSLQKGDGRKSFFNFTNIGNSFTHSSFLCYSVAAAASRKRRGEFPLQKGMGDTHSDSPPPAGSCQGPVSLESREKDSKENSWAS